MCKYHSHNVVARVCMALLDGTSDVCDYAVALACLHNLDSCLNAKAAY